MQQLGLPPNDLIVQQNNHEYRIWKLEQAINDNTMPPFTAPLGPWPAQLFPPRWLAHYDYSVQRATITASGGSGQGSFYVNGVRRWVVDIVDGVGVQPLLNDDLFELSVVQVALDDGILSDIVWQLAMKRLS